MPFIKYPGRTQQRPNCTRCLYFLRIPFPWPINTAQGVRPTNELEKKDSQNKAVYIRASWYENLQPFVRRSRRIPFDSQEDTKQCLLLFYRSHTKKNTKTQY